LYWYLHHWYWYWYWYWYLFVEYLIQDCKADRRNCPVLPNKARKKHCYHRTEFSIWDLPHKTHRNLLPLLCDVLVPLMDQPKGITALCSLCNSNTFWPALSRIHRLHYTSTLYQVRRTLVLTCWSRVVELFPQTCVQFQTAVVLNQNSKPIFFNQPSIFSNLLSFLFYQFYFMRTTNCVA